MANNKKFIFNCKEDNLKSITFEKTTTISEDSNVEFQVDYETESMSIFCKGPSVLSVNGFALTQGFERKLNIGDCIRMNDLTYYLDLKSEGGIKRSAEENTTVEKRIRLAPIFNLKKDTAKKKLEGGDWEKIGNDLLIFTPKNIKHQEKIAGFDMDGTLIQTKSGKVFPENNNDWKIIFGNVSRFIQDCLEENYKPVIFTNQYGLGNNPHKIPGFKQKVWDVLEEIGVPMQVFVSLTRSIYRKPAPGMWDCLLNDKNGGVAVDVKDSFYVGDAAGRLKGWSPGKNKDHSVADRLFARNLGLKFYTPEEFFLQATPVAFQMPKLNPENLVGVEFEFKVPDKNEVIIMVGSPGSGKSLFCKNFLINQGYVHINRDTLGTWQNCIKHLEKAVKENKYCVVDNTNRDTESRKKYIECAKKFNVTCRCMIMEIDKELARHNNRFREITDNSHLVVSDIIINSHYKNFQQPTLNEGFSEIIRVPYVSMLTDKKLERLYKMYLLEN